MKRKGSNLKYLPTSKIEEILNDPYHRGSDGSDYEDFKTELQEILWERQNKIRDLELKKYLKESEIFTWENFSLPSLEKVAWILANFVKLDIEKFFSKKS